jgi:hypothetical protein
MRIGRESPYSRQSGAKGGSGEAAAAAAAARTCEDLAGHLSVPCFSCSLHHCVVRFRRVRALMVSLRASKSQGCCVKSSTSSAAAAANEAAGMVGGDHPNTGEVRRCGRRIALAGADDL